MGDDFRYQLFFPRQNLWPVLESIALLSDLAPEEPLQVIFPDRRRSFPFEPFGKTPATIRWDEPSFEFATSLCFETDPTLLNYQRREALNLRGNLPSEDEDTSISIGYIYVAVETELPDTEAALVEFSTPGSGISFLFRESSSIRKTFLRLLKAHAGVCGVLDLEMSAEIFWWQGRAVKKFIHGDVSGTSDLSFGDYERFMRRRSRDRKRRSGEA